MSEPPSGGRPRRRSARLVVMATIALVLVVAVIGGIWWFRDDASSPAPVGSGDADAQAVAEVLRGLPQDPAAGFSADVADEVASDPHQYVPDGAVIEPDQESWQELAEDMSTVDLVMTMPDGTQREYRAVMVLQEGAWVVAATIEIEVTG
ncbi:hypothetical protein [Ruania rhizosphaerae]|uniref:hypothetical protein n=1 Tax=Ruania rhizosphaerae TaxID=1840413 RepID=UPI001359DB49|nr:hypothetical protein [Ruania rhizosphaerae]